MYFFFVLCVCVLALVSQVVGTVGALIIRIGFGGSLL